MITTDDLAKAPLFADLDHDTLDFIARNVADIHLVSGEYVVHEGDERALFVIIAGHFEVTKMVDGVERVLGPRTVGGIFGEVPMTLGSMFPAAMRATAPSPIAMSFTASAPARRTSRPRSGSSPNRASRGCVRSPAPRPSPNWW
jgi:thioredoxin reductase (NADPH)